MPENGRRDEDLATFTCAVSHSDQAVVFRPHGRLDPAAAVVFRTMFLKVLAEQPAAIVVDLTNTVVTDSRDATVFAAMSTHAQAWPGCPLVLYGARSELGEALRALQTQRHAAVVETWDQALVAIQRSPPPGRVSKRFPPAPVAVPAARQAVQTACRQWGISPSVASRVEVVVAELVTNAVRHGAGPVELTAQRSEHYVHVAVRDRSSALPHLTGPVSPVAVSGRGLLIVEGFCAAWGVTPTSDGKVVWATVRYRGPT